jgi:hypothetical protein
MKFLLPDVFQQAYLVVDRKSEQLVLAYSILFKDVVDFLEDHPSDPIGRDAHLCPLKENSKGLKLILMLV